MPPSHERRNCPPKEAAPESPTKATSSSVLEACDSLADRPVLRPIYGVRPDPALFLGSLLQDLLNLHTCGHWLRRAEEWDRLDPFVALQCRRHAWLLADLADDTISEDVWNVLAEVA